MYIKTTLFPWNPLNRKIQTKLGIVLPYIGMKSEKNSMVCFGQVVSYDMTLSPKDTHNASMYIKTTLFPWNPLNRKSQPKVGKRTTIHGDEIGEEWHGVLWTGGMI
jgi:hypothetical protein